MRFDLANMSIGMCKYVCVVHVSLHACVILYVQNGCTCMKENVGECVIQSI